MRTGGSTTAASNLLPADMARVARERTVRDTQQADESAHLRAEIPSGATLRDALERLQASSTAMLIVVDGERRLVGSLSDGDARRAFLAGADLDGPVRPWMHRTPLTVPVGTDRAAVLDLMRARAVPQIPEVDGEGRVVRLHLLREIVGGTPIRSTAVIMAGGRGTRLRAVTGDLPKSMVEVAGRPILERLVLHLVGSGVRDVVMAVGYRAEVIETFFADGARYGCRIRYLREDRPLGTAGPLRGLLPLDDVGVDEGLPLLVMNGDLVTSFSVPGLLAAHRDASARLTVGVTEYAHEVPYGVLETSQGTRVTGVLEKPTWRSTVSAGIYAIDPGLIPAIPADREVPMTDLITGCLDRGDPVHVWQVTGDWHDVGRPDDLAAARGL